MGTSLPPIAAADALLFGPLPPAAAAKKQRTVPPAQDVRTLDELKAAEATAKKDEYLKAAAATAAARAEIAMLKTDSTLGATGVENKAVTIGQPDFKYNGAYLMNYTL